MVIITVGWLQTSDLFCMHRSNEWLPALFLLCSLPGSLHLIRPRNSEVHRLPAPQHTKSTFHDPAHQSREHGAWLKLRACSERSTMKVLSAGGMSVVNIRPQVLCRW